MLTRSAKNKGAILQKLVRDYILASFPLNTWDVKSTTMGERGVDVQLSEKAREFFNFNIECKNVERLNLWASWEQACSRPDAPPLLVVKRNKCKPLVVMDANDFFNLVRSKRIETSEVMK